MAGLIVLLVVGFWLGPEPAFEAVNRTPKSLDLPLEELDDFVAAKDSRVFDMKPNNHGRILWADSTRKTPYAIVYLHGFSASPMEGEPIHRLIAADFGCNLYIPRLREHGRSTKESFIDLTPTDLVEEAKEAIALGHLLGDSVILMGCSTGATLGTYLASGETQHLKGMVWYSPNFALASPMAPLMSGHWGAELAGAVVGTYRKVPQLKTPEAEQYTTMEYRTEGLICLQNLLDQTMTPEVFSQVELPYFIGYYYQNDTAKDETISLEAIDAFVQHSQTPAGLREVVAFPEAGGHVICSQYQSEAVPEVYQATRSFVEEILGLKPVRPATPEIVLHGKLPD